ncbi:MAG: NirA family protein [Hyphomicrobiales bacterium]|nr:NirA family protein [Hyphomicrobiales bacterium]
MTQDLSSEQKRYLEGFASGMAIARNAAAPPPAALPQGPDAAALRAMDETERAGKKLSDQEKWKRKAHPFDEYPRLKAQALAGTFPSPEDNFRWRYYGLFYVGPAQDSYMLRLRIANGILRADQMAGLARLAERFSNGTAQVTTRANLQMREIAASDTTLVVEAVQDLGLTSRGSGADNIRNVTGSPTAGIDAQELLDTRPLARAWHFHVLNDRSLAGLPRKFNVAFDGGGALPVLEETNDIGFQAVEVPDGVAGIAPGVWCRLVLGGISGHGDLARDTGVICRPEQCSALADAILRVFIDKGDRTNRARARLKYVLDAMGFAAFLDLVEALCPFKLQRIDTQVLKPRGPLLRNGHIGVHRQSQAGFNWVGVALPVGRLNAAQMRGLAALAQTYGDGDLRLTVWQNLLLSGVSDENVGAVEAGITALGLATQASAIAGGLVACTGSTGCKFAAADTKADALAIAAAVEGELAFDTPLNVHVTGCHNSCAQHYIGDIGLIGAKVPVNDEGDTVPGYDLVVGGGYGAAARIGRLLRAKIRAEAAPALVIRLLAAWLAQRDHADETFAAFALRHDDAALLQMLQPTDVTE